MQIVVLGYIVRGPLGGLAWHHLQYVLGLKQLGHQILFLEDSDDFPSCYNPDTFEVSNDPTYGLKFINELFKIFGLQHQWSYFDFHTNTWFGKTKSEVTSFCTTADIVLNLSAVNPVRPWWGHIPCRVLVDTDPGFTQIRHLTDPISKELALSHTSFFSFAENIGIKTCTIPYDGFNWKTTRQPIYLDAWKVASFLPAASWTTVMQWDSYKVRAYNNKMYGMKSLSFKAFEQLPLQFDNEIFELAMGSASAPKEELIKKGWKIISSLIPTKTPWTYQNYIANSKGEWSVAKHGYVESNSGWFSERSACYLASGKPVVVQETGFSKCIETGKGLFSFQSMEEVKENIEIISKDYESHCKGARKLAEEYFDSKKVLNNLLVNC